MTPSHTLVAESGDRTTSERLPALRVRGLTIFYAGRPPVIRDVDLDVAPGEIVALLGKSGSGKSSILDAILGLLPETAIGVLPVTHDLALAAHRAHGGVLLAGGTTAARGDVAAIAHGVTRQTAPAPSLTSTKSAETMLHLDAVRRLYPGTRTATGVHEATVTLPADAAVGLVGGSVAGKTTLARLLTGLESPDAATVRFRGRDVWDLDRPGLREFRRAVQLVAQHPRAALDPRYPAHRAIEEPLRAFAIRLLGVALWAAINVVIRRRGRPGRPRRGPTLSSSSGSTRWSLTLAAESVIASGNPLPEVRMWWSSHPIPVNILHRNNSHRHSTVIATRTNLSGALTARRGGKNGGCPCHPGGSPRRSGLPPPIEFSAGREMRY